MSIQAELTRITNAKAAIKTAIEGKGVTVPDATLLDGMAALIEAIEAGGGDFTGGTITFSEELTVGNGASTGYKIEHGLGKNLTFFCFMANYPGSNLNKYLRLFAYCAYQDYRGNSCIITGNSSEHSTAINVIARTSFSDENEAVVYGIASTDVVYPTKYVWIAAAI